MQKSITVTQAESVIYRKVNRFMAGRALEMFRHLTDSRTTVSGLYVPKDWPMHRGITFRRDADGKDVVLYLDKKTQKFCGKAL